MFIQSHLPEYLKKDVTEKAWTEIAAQVQLPVYECKEKWKNLRYSLLRSLKPNPDGSAKKKYYLHNEMEFIFPFMKPRAANLQIEDDIDDETLFEDGDQPQLNEFEFCTTEPPQKKRKTENTQKSSLNASYIPTSNIDENSRKMFLLSLMPEINLLTECQMRIFRRKILVLIDNITENNHQVESNGDDYSSKSNDITIKTEPY